MNVKNDSVVYVVGKCVAESVHFRLYLCSPEASGRSCLLQIARDVSHNGAIDRSAFFLSELKSQADRLEEEYARVKTNQKSFLNYDLGFPELVDSFICSDQGGRRINILAFRGVNDVRSMVPVGNVIYKDGLRVDLRTSVWIMGKVLKFLIFTHDVNITNGDLSPNNILIEPQKDKDHAKGGRIVSFFDWSGARMYDGRVPVEKCCAEIAQASCSVLALLGYDSENDKLPDDEGGKYRAYGEFLNNLAHGNQGDAKEAHASFYELVDGLWERAYHPFTACKR